MSIVTKNIYLFAYCVIAWYLSVLQPHLEII